MIGMACRSIVLASGRPEIDSGLLDSLLTGSQ